MRRLTIFAAVLLFSLSACKKDYTCRCEDENGDVATATYQNVSKEDAEDLCSENEYNIPGGGRQDCEIL